MRRRLVEALERWGLAEPLRLARSRLRLWWGAGDSRRAVAGYLAGDGPHLLQIGCGPHPLEGWLNTDLEPRRPGVVGMDAGRPLPLPGGVFDRVFAEHLIEHLPRERGQALLGECLRVLKPGARLRLDTPDLGFFTSAKDTSAGREFIELARERYLGEVEGPAWAAVLDHWARSWGHRFLYDEETLRHDLEGAGFAVIKRYPEGQTEDKLFRGVERHGAGAHPRMNALSTLALEAEKPA